MRTNKLLQLLVCCQLCLIATVANGLDGPVSLTAAFADSKTDNQTRTLNILVNIEPGWHIYDVAPKDGSATRATFELKTPKGIQTIGKVTRPASLPSFKKPDSKIYQLSAAFSQKVKIDDDFKGGKIELSLNYQVCNEKLCQPVDTLKTSVAVPATDNKKAKDIFAAPILLMVGDKPLNTAARQMYPSPAIFDIDNDGQNELVVGDIFGTLNVYENQNDTGNGDPVWSEHKSLKSNDGKDIKVKNW